MTPQLDAVVAQVRRLLGDDLVAIYLHGSLALGGFNPGCSDIDLDPAELRAYADFVAEEVRGLRA